MKTTITRDLPADVYADELAERAFPNQSSGGQWLDEAQFEAYRELSYGIVDQFREPFPELARSDEPAPDMSERHDYGGFVA